jgi:hypothetical protein
MPHTRRAVAARADHHDLGDRQRLRHVEDATLLHLGNAGDRVAGARLARLRVALGDIEVFHDHVGLRECGRARAWQLVASVRGAAPAHHALDLAALAGILAGEHDHGVALPDVGDAGGQGDGGPGGHQSTSGASETIFM